MLRGSDVDSEGISRDVPCCKRSLAAEHEHDRQNLEKKKVNGEKDRTVFGGILINSSHSSLRGHVFFWIAAGIPLAQRYDQKGFSYAFLSRFC